MRTYPNTTIASPSSFLPATHEERREEMDPFRIRDFKREQLLIRPVTATVMRSKIGDNPAVFSDILVLTGSRKGKVYANVPIFNSLIVPVLVSVLDTPHAQVIAGLVGTHPVGEFGSTPALRLTDLTSESDINYASEQASALGWGSSTPATDKELLGWNLSAAREASKLTQSDASQSMGMTQPTLSAIESGSRSVTALELRRFARLYRTTMAHLLP